MFERPREKCTSPSFGVQAMLLGAVAPKPKTILAQRAVPVETFLVHCPGRLLQLMLASDTAPCLANSPEPTFTQPSSHRRVLAIVFRGVLGNHRVGGLRILRLIFRNDSALGIVIMLGRARGAAFWTGLRATRFFAKQAKSRRHSTLLSRKQMLAGVRERNCPMPSQIGH